MEDNVGNLAPEQFKNIWRVYRGGEEVEVREQDLTDDEVRALRCNELLQEFDLAPLYEEVEFLKREIKKREERAKRLSTFTGAEAFVKKMRHKVGGVVVGKTSASEVTAKDARTLETVYVRTLPYAALSPEDEAKLREMVRKSAKDDHVAGRFQTLADALRHYGLDPKTEGVEG